MKLEVLEKIEQSLEVLAAPVATIATIWSASSTVSAIVSGTFVLAISVVEYLKLFVKKQEAIAKAKADAEKAAKAAKAVKAAKPAKKVVKKK